MNNLGNQIHIFKNPINFLNLDKKMNIAKKRGRPRKMRLLEERKKLQHMLFSHDVSYEEQIIIVLEKINSFAILDKEECHSSKLGNLLKNIFCSKEHKIWHHNGEILSKVKILAKKIINAK